MRGLARGVVRRFWRWLAKRRPVETLWQLLDVTGIVVFVGPNGSGKSLAAVASSLPVLDGQTWECWEATHAHHAGYRQHQLGCPVCTPPAAVARAHSRDKVELCEVGRLELVAGSTGERLVYSTVVLLDDQGDEHPRYRPLFDYRTLLLIEHADALFDEVAGVSDAGDSGQIPVQVVQWLHTLRKRDVRLRVTTPAYSRCSKPIRQVAQLVVDCRSYAPEPAVAGRLWRPRQAFMLRAFDAFAFEDFTAGTKERLQTITTAAFWRPGHRAERAYDTLGQVLMLGHVTDAGMCSNCGGTRSRPKCACPAETHAAEVQLVVEESVSAAGTRTRRAVPAGEIAGDTSGVPAPASPGARPRRGSLRVK